MCNKRLAFLVTVYEHENTIYIWNYRIKMTIFEEYISGLISVY